MEFFELRGERKKKDGSLEPWIPGAAVPKHPGDYTVYSPLEAQFLRKIDAAVLKSELKFKGGA
jgi:cytidine deaminase